MTAGLQRLLEATDARARLSAIPGVAGIGLGLKEQAGRIIPEFVFRVYVKRKKPLAELSPEERIPPEIDGIRTDVLVLQEEVEWCTPTVVPGKEFTRDLSNTAVGGSIGCVVRDAATTRYILTNQHTIIVSHPHPSEREIYQPNRSECLPGVSVTRPVALVLSESAPWVFKGDELAPDGKTFYLDCGLLQIRSGVKAFNDIEGVGQISPAVRDLSAPAVPLTVDIRKRGARTGLTRGVAVEFHAFSRWRLKIVPATPSSGYVYDETYTIAQNEPMSDAAIQGRFVGTQVTATLLGPRRFRFQGPVFSYHGDSGSVCVDDERRAAALVYGGDGVTLKVEGEDDAIDVPTGATYACHIEPALRKLGLDPATAIVVSAEPASGPATLRPGDEITTHSGSGDMSDRWTAIAAAAHTTERGRRLVDLVRAHQHELIWLVNHHRRVAVTWQRNKGPAFVAALIDAARIGSEVVPRTVAGHSLLTLLDRMMDVLRVHGSPALRDAIHREGEFVLRLVRDHETVRDLVDAMDADRHEEAVS